jgi:hypothetical protein
MADIAGIWDLQALGFRGRDEAERMATNVHTGNGLLDFGHVAADALAAGAAHLMVSVLLDGGRARAVGRTRAVAIEAQNIDGLEQVGVVSGSVHIVATEAGHATGIHHAIHEIITLHSILVAGTVGEMGKGCLAELVVFELPVILKIQANLKTHRPIVIFPFDLVLQWAALRMALHADIVRMDVIEAGGVHDVRAGWMLNMCGSGSVAFLTADIPFRYRFGLDVVVHRMAAVAKRARGALEIITGIQRDPPVGSGLDGIGSPNLMSDVPLHGQRKIVVADFLKIALLPFASVTKATSSLVNG